MDQEIEVFVEVAGEFRMRAPVKTVSVKERHKSG